MDTSSLMEQILSNDNLNRAYLQVVRNKGAEGADGMKYTELKEYLAKNGEIIKEQLRIRKYKPQPVRRVEIPKPDGGVRNLGVPTVTDRFIQQAIAQVLTPIYEEQFHDHSYGFRPNRCAQQAILTALDMMNDGNDWIVDIDLEKFFDTVNHDKLMTIIGRTIKDGDVISIIRKYLVSGIMIDDEYEDSIVGTPQGGNLSPLLANIMLNELDKEMEKGTVLVECGKLLQRGGYRIKVLNTINFKKSMRYNPFAYIRSEKDILKLVNTLIANTKGDGEKAGEDFWVKSERLFYCALIGYIWYEAPEEEKNFTTLLEMINASEAREDDPEFQSPVDLMFERLEEKDPEHFAVRQYKKFLLSAGKTRSSILISCGARLAPFDIKELRDLMETDEMELDTIGDRKTALFVIISDTDDTFNFVVSILYTQLFNLLCDKADDEYGGRLPVHVRCLLDEFANIGQIPKFEKLIATIRSREISASIILQSQSQLKAIYKDNADTIAGNCDTTLFLGGKEKTTLKEMSEILGKETIDSFNTSENRGREVSHGLNYQKLGKQLMTEDEIAVMDGGKCILQLRGVRPFFSDKYDITKHPNYKYLSDYDKKNTLDMEKHLRRRPALVKPDEPFDYYEISEADLQEDTDHE